MKAVIVGLGTVPALICKISTIRNPSRKLLKEPATRISSRFQTFWLPKARGSSDSPSSPVMAQ